MTQRNERVWHIVDVRSEAERAVSIIPGSISWDAYRTHLEVYRENPVLVYCTVGCRSAGYVQSLQELNVEVYNLWGGVIEWAQHGGTFTTEAGMPTKKVHTHGRRWDMLPPTYKAVW